MNVSNILIVVQSVDLIMDISCKANSVPKKTKVGVLYLGHANIAATQVYLTMTPALLHEASVKFEKYVFGEVRHD